ncbi:heavy-metal-associated domain-containing protein [Sulfuriflexus mobilis]|uniref:heavy-metal-associated domain-containing protein n=1 Tax=Sulfuriflexus mobilis TaxID=1811807 RepID=UPI000F84A5BE|nr:heavy metal-associated domain-containing protein [Sulfuriflexus mobilis]
MSESTHLVISGMKCAGCVANVQKALEALDGVNSVEVSLESASATVRGDADPAELARVVTEAGYPATLA